MSGGFKTAQGAAWQKPFLWSVTRLGALPCGAPVPGGMKALIPVLLGVLSMVMVARSLWSMCRSRKSSGPCPVPLSPLLGTRCRGALTQPPGSATDEEKDYQDMICLGRKGGCFSQGEKGPEPLSPGAFIRFIRIGIQIKLINHCQSVRVKQYKIYRELWGLILSYSQLVRGP